MVQVFRDLDSKAHSKIFKDAANHICTRALRLSQRAGQERPVARRRRKNGNDNSTQYQKQHGKVTSYVHSPAAHCWDGAGIVRNDVVVSWLKMSIEQAVTSTSVLGRSWMYSYTHPQSGL